MRRKNITTLIFLSAHIFRIKVSITMQQSSTVLLDDKEVGFQTSNLNRVDKCDCTGRRYHKKETERQIRRSRSLSFHFEMVHSLKGDESLMMRRAYEQNHQCKSSRSLHKNHKHKHGPIKLSQQAKSFTLESSSNDFFHKISKSCSSRFTHNSTFSLAHPDSKKVYVFLTSGSKRAFSSNLGNRCIFAVLWKSIPYSNVDNFIKLNKYLCMI